MDKDYLEGSRDFFVMSSDGDDDIRHYADEVIANIETVCRAAKTNLCWTAGNSVEPNLCVVRMVRTEVKVVQSVKVDDFLKLVHSWAYLAVKDMIIAGDGDTEYGAEVKVTTTVTDNAVEIDLSDGDGTVRHGLVITTLEG